VPAVSRAVATNDKAVATIAECALEKIRDMTVSVSGPDRRQLVAKRAGEVHGLSQMH
jgi:hypothetical protein